MLISWVSVHGGFSFGKLIKPLVSILHAMIVDKSYVFLASVYFLASTSSPFNAFSGKYERYNIENAQQGLKNENEKFRGKKIDCFNDTTSSQIIINLTNRNLREYILE